MERLTPNEYRNAVYLDFEGEGKKRNGFIPQPHMAGIFEPNEKGKGGKYNSFFFLKEWMPVANHLKRSSRLVGFSEYFEVLVDQLIVSKNHLVCWSIHEPMILEMYLPKSTFTKLLPTIHNLHPVAKNMHGEEIYSDQIQEPMEKHSIIFILVFILLVRKIKHFLWAQRKHAGELT